MTLHTWLTARGIDPARALSVTVGTDGLSPEKHNLLAVSCTGAADVQDIGTMYIKGADPSASLGSTGKSLIDITGVSSDTYYDNAMDVIEAQVLANTAKKDSSFLVMHTARFTRPWIQAHFPILADMPCLDMVALYKCMSVGIELPSVDTLGALQDEINRRTTYIQGGYRFEEVCARVIPAFDGDLPNSYMGVGSPALTRQVYKLRALYHALLTLEK